MSELFPMASEPVSEYSEVISEPGEWLPKQKAASRLGLSEKTIENWVKIGKCQGAKRNGRAFVFVSEALEREEAQKGNNRSYPEPLEIKSEIVRSDSDLIIEHLRSQTEALSEEIRNLREELSETLQLLVEAREHAARLEGEANGVKNLLEAKDQLIISKDETIQAKEDALNAAKGNIMLLERQTPSIQVAAPERQIEAASKPPRWKFWER